LINREIDEGSDYEPQPDTPHGDEKEIVGEYVVGMPIN
jgi:hypothetical protein